MGRELPLDAVAEVLVLPEPTLDDLRRQAALFGNDLILRENSSGGGPDRTADLGIMSPINPDSDEPC